MKRFNLLKDSTRIEKEVLYTKMKDMLIKYLFKKIDKPLINVIEAEIQKILTDNGYSDLQFQVTYKNKHIDVNFDD